ncbi:MAG: Zn-dependent oxidoreductase [Hyphomicrobiales bacterium]|nr:Zn-dependent oxidoreductase [Hyphomicrobiales bacterium]
MVAIAVEEPGRLKLHAAEAVAPDSGEVLVRVHKAGICGSDVHILHGSNPFARYPRIIGHEVSGRIESVGANVTGLEPGDRVVVDPVVSCGHCYACRIGRQNVCANLEVLGVHRDGGFRTYLPVSAANVVKVPATLPLAIAALAEPFSIAANVLTRTECSADDVILIYGAGNIGLTVLQVAKLMGARCIIADTDPARVAGAAKFGADLTVLATPDAVRGAVESENDGLGPTLVIDAAGAPELLREAVSLVSPAGRVGLLGFSGEPSELVQQDVVRKEISIHGSRLSRRLLPQVVGWLADGKLAPQSMITQTYKAEDAQAAFALLETDPSAAIKVQLDF